MVEKLLSDSAFIGRNVALSKRRGSRSRTVLARYITFDECKRVTQRLTSPGACSGFSRLIDRCMWAVSEWENGRVVPKKDSRIRLVAWLGYEPEMLCL